MSKNRPYESMFRATAREAAHLESCAQYAGISKNEVLRTGLKLVALEVGRHHLQSNPQVYGDELDGRLAEQRDLHVRLVEQMLERPTVEAVLTRAVASGADLN